MLTPEHYYRALSLAVRDRMQKRWMATTQDWLDLSCKVTCYLSAEFLMGPAAGQQPAQPAASRTRRARRWPTLGQDLDEILDCEEEPGLGNGGLGRLAACYLDSMATLERPSIGYGIRYEFGIFKPGDPGRLADREDRQLAGATATRGRSTSPTPATW